MEDKQNKEVRAFVHWLRNVKGFEIAQWLRGGYGKDELFNLREKSVEDLLKEYESRESSAT